MSAASELIPPEPKKPAKRRKPKKRSAARVAVAAKPDLGEFAGITAQACPAACNPEQGCIITRGSSGICAHPRKGGLQTADAIRTDVVKRFGEARKILDHADIEAKSPVR